MPSSACQSLLGISCIAGSVTIFSMVAVLVKLVPDIPVDELTVLRYAVQWAIAVVVLLVSAWRAKRTGQEPPWRGVSGCTLGFACLRSAGYFGMIYLMWKALRLLPVGDATILIYTSPLWCMLLSRMLLQHPLPISFALYAAMGASGAILVVQPTFIFGGGQARLDPFGVALALAAALSAASMQVLTFKVREVHWVVLDHTTTFMCWAVFSPLVLLAQMLSHHPISDALSVFDSWVFDERAAAVVTGMALAGFCGLSLNTIGYKLESPARGALIAYIEIPISYGLQILVWHDHPDWLAWLGVALVITCTLLNTLEKFATARMQLLASKEEPPSPELDALQSPMLHADTVDAADDSTQSEPRPEILEPDSTVSPRTSRSALLTRLEHRAKEHAAMCESRCSGGLAGCSKDGAWRYQLLHTASDSSVDAEDANENRGDAALAE